MAKVDALSPGLEEAAFWRELAASGADLSPNDLTDWGRALAEALAELRGAARVLDHVPAASGAIARAQDAQDAQAAAIAVDLHAYRARVERRTAALTAVCDRVGPEILGLRARWADLTADERARLVALQHEVDAARGAKV